MNDRPNASELLAIARATFTAGILDALPEEARYAGLMIANAMAIAQREIDAGDAPARAEQERLDKLLAGLVEPPAGNALHAGLQVYNRRLAEEIRAGRFDGPKRAAMLEHLRRTTEEKLAVSNPRLLAGQDRSSRPGSKI